jgi:hypothetical protein
MTQENSVGIETLPVTVAYLILAHGNPEQLVRLVDVLPKSSPVMIHFDKRADPTLYERAVKLLGERPKLKFVRRHVCRWGAIGIIEGTVSLIRGLVDSGMAFDYATLLSGSDYPIKSNREIAAFLEQHRGEEFLESLLLTEPNRWSAYGGLYKTPEKVLCRHLRFRSRVWRLPGFRTMPDGMKPYGGSQWWTLSRAAMMHIAEVAKDRPEVLSFFRHTFIPDESFIQSIVSNSHLADRVVSDDLRLIIWDRPTPPYPATLTIQDLDLLLASEKLFARKFHPGTDEAILDALDDRNGREETRLRSGTALS